MKLIKPKFWDRRYYSFLSLVLYPFSIIIDIRNFIYSFVKLKRYSQIKTICVGNIYLGGTGKTPLVNFLAKKFKNKYKTVIIKKKYQSHLDEKKLLEKNNKVFFENDREVSLIRAIKNDYELAIFDDGLQDKKILYDLKIVCFSSISLAGNQLRLPAGPLREKLTNLKRYDAVFFVGYKTDKKFIKKIRKINSKISIFSGEYVCVDYKKYKNGSYIVFSGIGNPKGFENTLKKYNIKFKSNLIYPDHYKYSENDISKLKKIAKNKNLKLLTTEKDFYRIPTKLRKNIDYLKINLKINKQKEFNKFIVKYL